MIPILRSLVFVYRPVLFSSVGVGIVFVALVVVVVLTWLVLCSAIVCIVTLFLTPVAHNVSFVCANQINVDLTFAVDFLEFDCSIQQRFTAKHSTKDVRYFVAC